MQKLGLTALHLFMLQLAVLIALCAEDTREIYVVLGESVVLPCEAHEKREVGYSAISWYKVGDDGIRLSGIVLRNFQQKKVKKYLGCTMTVTASSVSPYTLTIYNVSIQDLGTYRCSLWAPIGEENKNGQVRVTVKGGARTESTVSSIWLMVSMASGLLSLCVICLLIKVCSGQKENYGKLGQDLSDCTIPAKGSVVINT